MGLVGGATLGMYEGIGEINPLRERVFFNKTLCNLLRIVGSAIGMVPLGLGLEFPPHPT
jgi:hypothetical protein